MEVWDFVHFILLGEGFDVLSGEADHAIRSEGLAASPLGHQQ